MEETLLQLKLALLGVLLLLLTPMAFSLAETPPEGLDDTLETIIVNAYNTGYSTQGWSNTYSLPQSQYSLDAEDFFDNSAEFGGVGHFALGLHQLLNPQYDNLDLNSTIPASIIGIGTQTLRFAWTPTTANWGTHHQQTLPSGNIATVMERVQGILGPSAVCHEPITINYNQWSVPESTSNAVPQSSLEALSGAGTTFLLAAKHTTSPTEKEKFTITAAGIGETLLSALITPKSESFGIHPNQVMDDNNKTLPTGMLPREFSLITNTTDTTACQDGGTIELNENEKTQMAFAAYFFDQLYKETTDERYRRARDYVIEGILALQECDGTYRNYTRWAGAGRNPITCTPDNGGEEFIPYAGNAIVADTRGQLVDNSLILYLLQQTNPTLYKDNPRFKNAVQFFLELEENDTDGVGYNKNGSVVKNATYLLAEKYRPFARLMLAELFLFSSCNETDAAVEKRLQSKAYDLIQRASLGLELDVDSRIVHAIHPSVGTTLLSASAAANMWKIVTKGCAECTDGDGDGFIDGTCAGDTVKYDCNDSNSSIFPNSTEACDGIDNDCDGAVDNGFDADEDGYAICRNDCNDEDDKIYPNASELLDEKDNDCNEKIDDTGILIQLLDDQNQPIPTIEVNFVAYGNACVNSFAQKVENFASIKQQCKIEAYCNTDSNGTCLGFFKIPGKFQAFAGVQGEALFSGPIDFQVGNRTRLVMQTVSGINILDGNTTAPADTNQSNPNGGETNYLFMGLLVIVLVIGGIGVALFYRMGKFPKMSSASSKAAATATKTETKPPAKTEIKVEKTTATALKKEMPISTPTKTVKENPKPKWKGSDKTMPKESQ